MLMQSKQYSSVIYTSIIVTGSTLFSIIQSYNHTIIHSYTHTIIQSYNHTIQLYNHTIIHYNYTIIHSYNHTIIQSYSFKKKTFTMLVLIRNNKTTSFQCPNNGVLWLCCLFVFLLFLHGFDDFNKGPYFTSKVIFNKAHYLYLFDCEITLESVTGIDMY